MNPNDILSYMEMHKLPITPDQEFFLEMIDSNPSLEVSFYAPTSPLEYLENRPAHFIYKQDISYAKVEWSPQLEEQLLTRSFKLSKPSEDLFRFGVLLLSNMDMAEAVAGRDYANKILQDFASHRFANVIEVQSILDSIVRKSVLPNNDVVTWAKEYVDRAVTGIGNSLVFQLKYSNPQAFQILVGAVIYTIDRRFNISLRRSLFPK